MSDLGRDHLFADVQEPADPSNQLNDVCLLTNLTPRLRSSANEIIIIKSLFI